MSNQCPYCSGQLKKGYNIWKNYEWQWTHDKNSENLKKSQRTNLAYKCKSCEKEILVLHEDLL